MLNVKNEENKETEGNEETTKNEEKQEKRGNREQTVSSFFA